MKKIIFFLFTLFTLFTITLSAQSNLVTKFDKEINHHLFNGDWGKSDSLTDIKLGEQPNSLKYNFMKAYSYFYTRYVSNNNPYDRDATIRQVKKYTWEAIRIGEQ